MADYISDGDTDFFSVLLKVMTMDVWGFTCGLVKNSTGSVSWSCVFSKWQSSLKEVPSTYLFAGIPQTHFYFRSYRWAEISHSCTFTFIHKRIFRSHDLVLLSSWGQLVIILRRGGRTVVHKTPGSKVLQLFPTYSSFCPNTPCLRIISSLCLQSISLVFSRGPWFLNHC